MRFRRVLAGVIGVVGLLFGVTSEKLQFDGYISKVAWSKEWLAVGLENGKVELLKWGKQKPEIVVELPKSHDFTGEEIPMPIYSLDFSPDQKKLLILGEGDDAKREVFIYSIPDQQLKRIWETKITLMRGIFTKDRRLFFGLLSDEALLFNPITKKVVYRTQIGNYVFSSWAIGPNREIAIFGDESGAPKVVEIGTGKRLGVVEGWNKDKSVALDFNGVLIGNGSADTRISIYNWKGGFFVTKFKNKFIPYGLAISPNGKLIAYQLDEQNRIALQKLGTKEVKILEGHTMALNGMKFLSNRKLLSFSPAELIIWDLEGKPENGKGGEGKKGKK
jgi:WD40 repeat protein